MKTELAIRRELKRVERARQPYVRQREPMTAIQSHMYVQLCAAHQALSWALEHGFAMPASKLYGTFVKAVKADV